MPTLPAATSVVVSTLVPDPTGHIAAIAARKARKKAHRASIAAQQRHEAMPLGTPRRRAPKVSRVPSHVEPHDTAGRLRQMGFKSAVGPRYLCAWVSLTGPGTSYGIPLPMQGSASSTLTALETAIADSPMRDAEPVIWMDPDDCKLLLYWPLPREGSPPYGSLFGLKSLTKRGDVLEVPYSAFPANVKTPAHRQRAVHMDHALTREHPSVWIDAVADDARQVVTVTRVTDSNEPVQPSPPPARGPTAPLALPITQIPGTRGLTTVTATVPLALRPAVGAGSLTTVCPEDHSRAAAALLRGLAGRLANCARSVPVPRLPVIHLDFEPPY